jgi:hypothetical protein
VPDIAKRLASSLCNLAKGIALKEMKFQCLPLFSGKLAPQSIQDLFSGQLIDGGLPSRVKVSLFAQVLDVIMMANAQIPPAVDSPVVSHLDDP